MPWIAASRYCSGFSDSSLWMRIDPSGRPAHHVGERAAPIDPELPAGMHDRSLASSRGRRRCHQYRPSQTVRPHPSYGRRGCVRLILHGRGALMPVRGSESSGARAYGHRLLRPEPAIRSTQDDASFCRHPSRCSDTDDRATCRRAQGERQRAHGAHRPAHDPCSIACARCSTSPARRRAATTANAAPARSTSTGAASTAASPWPPRTRATRSCTIEGLGTPGPTASDAGGLPGEGRLPMRLLHLRPDHVGRGAARANRAARRMTTCASS